MKPTSMFEAYKEGGVAGLMDKLNERKERFMKGIPDSKTQFDAIKKGLEK